MVVIADGVELGAYEHAEEPCFSPAGRLAFTYREGGASFAMIGGARHGPYSLATVTAVRDGHLLAVVEGDRVKIYLVMD